MHDQINIHEAKTQLSRLVQRATEGKDTIIAKAGKPVARLTAYHRVATVRQPGQWRSKVSIKDDFDSLPPELAAAFRGKRS